jgi:hypothetical protein
MREGWHGVLAGLGLLGSATFSGDGNTQEQVTEDKIETAGAQAHTFPP